VLWCTDDNFLHNLCLLYFVGLEPVLGLPNMLIRTYTWQWVDKEQTKYWQAVKGCHQAKMFLHGPDKRLTHFALGLRKRDLRILVGRLTRHYTLNRHLAIMRIQDDPLCPAYVEVEETPNSTFWEMLCHCADKVPHPRGLHTTARGAMWDITIKLVAVCQSLIEVIVTLVTSGMCNGPTANGLSAEQSIF